METKGHTNAITLHTHTHTHKYTFKNMRKLKK